MEFRNRQQPPLTIWLGINLIAAVLGLFATLWLVLWIRDSLEGFYQIPTSGISAFPFELRLFFIVGFSVAGLLIGIVTGLIQWWMIRCAHGVASGWILLSTVSWLVSLPLSYEIFAILNDLFGFSRPNLTTSIQLMPLVLLLIYLISGLIASIGEKLILKITE